MGLYKLVDKNLTKAFNAIKDLAIVATFVKKTNPTFDFNKGLIKTTIAESVDAKVIIVDNTKEATDRNTQQLQIMFKVSDVGDIFLYETVSIDSISWKIGKYIKTDRFVSVIELFRED